MKTEWLDRLNWCYLTSSLDSFSKKVLWDSRVLASMQEYSWFKFWIFLLKTYTLVKRWWGTEEPSRVEVSSWFVS